MIDRDAASRSEHHSAEQPLWKRLVWFAGLWLGGVAVVGTVAYFIRMMLRV
ncbi:MAG: DUF2474 domain-containing protein [Hyphomicrobiaceae bacterium]